MSKMGIGIVGCGNISSIYLKNLGTAFEATRLVACADKLPERAEARAKEYGIEALTVAELLARDDIDTVVNLTIPNAHFEVCRAALSAGKHAYVEKPLSIERADAAELARLAEANGLRLGGAPDTFLGGGHQTCRKLVDEGAIGEPVACVAFMICGGHETWHPDPEFYYKPGGGPLFDMGPYYLTAMVNLLGPVRRVSASARISFPERLITSEPKKGTRVTVEVPTHVAGMLEFAGGAIGTLIMSFDVRGGHTLPCIQLFGSEGSLDVPDPNGFGGDVRLRRAGGDWESVPLTHGYAENSRGIGVADIACAVRNGRAHRASGALAGHVLDVMTALHESAATGKHVTPATACERPAPLPVGLGAGELD